MRAFPLGPRQGWQSSDLEIVTSHLPHERHARTCSAIAAMAGDVLGISVSVPAGAADRACIWPAHDKQSHVAHLQGHHIGAVAHEQAQQRWQGLLQQLGQIPSRSMPLHMSACLCRGRGSPCYVLGGGWTDVGQHQLPLCMLSPSCIWCHVAYQSGCHSRG